jgi:hypothetical protein
MWNRNNRRETISSLYKCMQGKLMPTFIFQSWMHSPSKLSLHVHVISNNDPSFIYAKFNIWIIFGREHDLVICLYCYFCNVKRYNCFIKVNRWRCMNLYRHVHRHIQEQGVRVSLFKLNYRLVKRFLTEYFLFRPCHFSFYHEILLFF